MRYEVDYVDVDGKARVQKVPDCKDAGMAFAKAQKEHPGARMVSCRAFCRDTGYGEAQIFHEAPPVQRDPIREPRPAGPPKATDRDGIMAFYDEVKNKQV